MEAEQMSVTDALSNSASSGRLGRRAQPRQLSHCDVYVASFGDVLLDVRLAICNELWARNVRADYMASDELPTTQEELHAYCRHRAIPLLLIVKGQHRAKELATVKVRHIWQKHEAEVPRNDVADYVARELEASGTRGGRRDASYDALSASYRAQSADRFGQEHYHHRGHQQQHHHHDSHSTSAHPPLNVTVLNPSRTTGKTSKQYRKQAIIEKASKAVHSFTEQLAGGASASVGVSPASVSTATSTNMEVIAVDMPAALLRRVSSLNDLLDDDLYRREVVDTFPKYREQAQMLHQYLHDLKRTKSGFGGGPNATFFYAVLYSYVDDEWTMVRLPRS